MAPRIFSSAPPTRHLALVIVASCACSGERTSERRGDDQHATVDGDRPRARGAPAPAESSPTLRSLPTPRQARRALPEPALALPAHESFTVVSAGQGPRARRRYLLKAGAHTYSLTARLRGRVLDAGADPAPQEVPAVTETFALEPRPAASAAAPAVVHWRGLPASIGGPAAAPYVARWQSLLAGRRAQLELDARGQLGRVVFAEDPTGASTRPETDELTQRMLGLAVPLPEVAIGVGARWRVVTVLRQGLAVVKQTARYTLVEASADRLVVDLDVRRVGEAQELATPELPPGSSLELLALFRAVSGRVAVDLGSPLPTGELAVEARAHHRLRDARGAVTETLTEDTGALVLARQEPAPP